MARAARPGRVWITRTQPGAEATAARLRAMGLEPVVAPVIETRALAGAVLDLADVQALAFTSAAAVAAFSRLTPRRDWPVFTVGEATAAHARAAGFADPRSADGDVARLAKLIAAAPQRPAVVLYPTARDPAADLAGLLAAAGVRVRAAPVYETVATALAAAPRDLDAVLIHSAKAARRTAALIDLQTAAGLVVAAISALAAKPLADRQFRRILVARTPDEPALLALLRAPE